MILIPVDVVVGKQGEKKRNRRNSKAAAWEGTRYVISSNLQWRLNRWTLFSSRVHAVSAEVLNLRVCLTLV